MISYISLCSYCVLCMQGGVVYSNKVMVVSSIHSKDRIIRSFSHGLESTLAIHKWVTCLFHSFEWISRFFLIINLNAHQMRYFIDNHGYLKKQPMFLLILPFVLGKNCWLPLTGLMILYGILPKTSFFQRSILRRILMGKLFAKLHWGSTLGSLEMVLPLL